MKMNKQIIRNHSRRAERVSDYISKMVEKLESITKEGFPGTQECLSAYKAIDALKLASKHVNELKATIDKKLAVKIP